MDINEEGLKELGIFNVSAYGHSVVLTADPKDAMPNYVIKRAIDKLIDLNPHLELITVSEYNNLFGVPEALVVFKEKKKSLWDRIFSKKGIHFRLRGQSSGCLFL